VGRVVKQIAATWALSREPLDSSSIAANAVKAAFAAAIPSGSPAMQGIANAGRLIAVIILDAGE
jgi:hypothetical protein